MAARIPASAGRLEALDDGRCLLLSGTHSLDAMTYWLMALDVEFEVLAPAELRDHLRRAQDRLARSLARRGGAG
ncbi:hypothetical protein D3C72_2269390 [compost metagenome]